jgi:hypothetical protein
MRLFICREEIVVAGLCNWWGSMPYNSLSNPIVTEKAQCGWAEMPFRLQTSVAKIPEI